MRITTVFIVALTVLTTTGCLEDMDPISLISKFRVMGVLAEPPEIKPGEGTVLRVLYDDPSDRNVMVVWLTCLGVFSPGSTVASEIVGACTPVAPVGIGEGSDGEAEYEIASTPTDLDLGLDAGVDASIENVSVTVIVFLCAGGVLDGGMPFIPTDSVPEGGIWDMDLDALCTGGDSLIATKVVVISNSDNPNKNPEIDEVLLDGKPISPDQPYPCKGEDGCTSSIRIKASLTEESFQEYEDQFGEMQEESPYISWFVSRGKVSNDRARASEPDDPDSDTHGYFETKWEPKGSTATKFWLVAHDVRGGAAWKKYQIGIEPSTEADAGGETETSNE
jgi:hypothetical protein